FLVNVYKAQKREGEIALGSERLKIAVRPKDRALMLYGLGDRPVLIRNYRMIRKASVQKKNVSLELSVSELRQALGQDTQAVDAALGKIDTRTPVVATIDLGAFSTPDSRETVFPLLVRELYAARRQNAIFTLKGSANEVDVVLNEASKLYGDGQNFIYRQGEGLPEAFHDARRVIIAGASATERGDIKDERLLLVKNLERGELPNLKAILKTALFEARVEKLESTDPQFVRFLNAYRILLGNREISDVAEFIAVLDGNTRDLTVLQKYMIAPRPIAYDAVLRIYALMIKMAEQSA
ncbi:MAG TPA: hypothetical protein VD883_04150, partial [Candidatus Omnitrophota bacterium]|nr:hypothetical protein [Candidatus Omnitrophota bacterium]